MRNIWSRSVGQQLAALACLMLSGTVAAEPEGGWGPHYQNCLPEYFEEDFGDMTPPEDAVSGQFEKTDENNLLMWVKELTIWRVPCGNNPDFPATMVKVETIERGPADDSDFGNFDSLTAGRFRIIQEGIDSEPNSFASCSNISSCGKSFVEVYHGPEVRLIPRARNSDVDLGDAFSVKIEKTEGTLAVPGSDSESSPRQISLKGALSGSWYDPDRSGEGLVLEFGASGQRTMVTIYWFTYLDNRQYWLIGTEEYDAGDSSVTVDLYEVSANGFGDDFDPETVEQRYFGSMSLEFSSCLSGVATWESDIGLGEGDFQLERITGGLHGVTCE